MPICHPPFKNGIRCTFESALATKNISVTHGESIGKIFINLWALNWDAGWDRASPRLIFARDFLLALQPVSFFARKLTGGAVSDFTHGNKDVLGHVERGALHLDTRRQFRVPGLGTSAPGRC